MANKEHLKLLTSQFGGWDDWRRDNPDIIPDLSGANLEHKLLIGKNLSGANLFRAKLSYADLRKADLRHANLGSASIYFAHFNEADLSQADLNGAIIINSTFLKVNLEGASLRSEIQKVNFDGSSFAGTSLSNIKFHDCDLSGTNFSHADLSSAKIYNSSLSGANFNHAVLENANLMGCSLNNANFNDCTLRGAKLHGSSLVQTNLSGADLSGCEVYGVSVWGIKTDDKTRQNNLLITAKGEAKITVDDIEVAQFIYLLLRRQKLRNVIDTITSKAVLILGRFTPERKQILDALAEEVRAHQLLPIIYDFEGSASRDFTETIKILTGMSLFVIADVSNPKSSPLELQATIPDYQIPFVTIIQQGEQPFSMLSSLKKYPWVLQPVLSYSSAEDLRKAFKKAILDRAWEKRNELLAHKSQSLQVQSIGDFLGDD